jgi:hypothetical protein
MGVSWIPPHVYPLLLFIYFILWSFLPWSRRRGLWVTVKDTMIAPFAESKFRETFVGDVMTSVVKVMTDVVYTLCFFTSGAA